MIRGNRGDLASRYGILSQLHLLGFKDVTVFCDAASDIASLPYNRQPYGFVYNLIPRCQGLKKLVFADTVIWTGGIDLQDDSSLLKLCHTACAFMAYRLLGKRVFVFMQGAGPISSKAGRMLVRLIVWLTNAFVARDSGSLQLLRAITGSSDKPILGYDGIFSGQFPGNGATNADAALTSAFPNATNKKSALTIGFNIRLWYHFSNGVLPYHIQRKAYQRRSQERMGRLIDASCLAIQDILNRFPATIKLISMYEPCAMTWEDDEPILSSIKQRFMHESRVLLPKESLGLHDFCSMVGALDCMVGMRLHATLIALRFGVPSITLNYTLKGRDIFRDRGLSEYVIELEDVIRSPAIVADKVNQALSDDNLESAIQSFNKKAYDKNQSIFETILRD
jgi:polysaccharide pyruvyl transferase WcaK-like protein